MRAAQTFGSGNFLQPLLAFVLLFGLFAGAVRAAEGVDPDKGRPIFRSATELDYAPFSFVSEDGKADGFAVELLRACARRSGAEAGTVLSRRVAG